jgi:hypothetical protein
MNLLDAKDKEAAHFVLTALFTAVQLIGDARRPDTDQNRKCFVDRASALASDVLNDAKRRCDAAGVKF